MFLRMLKFSWRNIWRNARRTVITSLAVGFGLASLLFTESLMQGMISHMIEATTDPWMGDVQVHREGFLDTRQLVLTINRPDTILSMLSRDTTVLAYTSRVLSPASLSSARELKPVTLTGVDHTTDPGVTMLQSSIDTGSYLSGDSMEIILGYKLAGDLRVGLGDVLVITAAGADSGLASSMYILSGICRFGSDVQDRYSAFVNIGSARSLLGLEERVHEIAMVLIDPAMAEDTSLALWDNCSAHGNIAQGWKELAPQISSMLSMVDVSMLIMSAILFGLVMFGIVNSMFMSVYERMFELGIMKAVGTRPGTIGTMVMMEAFWLGVISTVAGLTLGLLIIWIASGSGISFGDIEFSGVVFQRPIFPEITFGSAWIYPVFTLLLTTLAGIFPGIHAARQNPAESMRRSL
jgi:ABC-type lipoprotein release transport system permease subunit